MARQGALNHDGLITLEQPLLKVPLEQFRKACRTSARLVEKELGVIGNAVDDLGSSEDPAKALDNMVTRLQNLKRKLEDSKAEEALYSARTRQRLEHVGQLYAIESSESEEYARWSQTRLDRILVDYLLREKYGESAKLLSAESGIQELVDIDLFATAQNIEATLRNRSCTECLQWCNDNKSNLRKIKSTLEFNLRLQEYIEHVRAGRLSEAIIYARKYLTPWSETHLREIQQAMGLLAFTPSTRCSSYRDLFSPQRWDAIISEFQRDHRTIHAVPRSALLRLSLQAGLSALRTPSCYDPEQTNVNCPVCSRNTLGELALGLPNAHHVNSCIVCRITGEMMDEDGNAPMVLPNGQVYSQHGIQKIAVEKHGVLAVRCPKTGTEYKKSEARRAFIS
ncbi:CTLH/CRA C-terminal to lish motif domain-containing protein [Cladochytrium replicatum]|nr:CTLH/CRA C-terminal to lish motif domain-containing protein [Cladochytrium replicatum]